MLKQFAVECVLTCNATYVGSKCIMCSLYNLFIHTKLTECVETKVNGNGV